jgi:predicted alpha/beta hydrolase family esterase
VPADAGRNLPTGAGIRCLIVPGLGGSGPDHWQTRWEEERADCVRVNLSHWDMPSRPTWVANLDAAILATSIGKVLVGHSLGCHAIAWWAAQASEEALGRVMAALFVAPPDVAQQGADHRLLRFVAATAIPQHADRQPRRSLRHARPLARPGGSVGGGVRRCRPSRPHKRPLEPGRMEGRPSNPRRSAPQLPALNLPQHRNRCRPCSTDCTGCGMIVVRGDGRYEVRGTQMRRAGEMDVKWIG